MFMLIKDKKPIKFHCFNFFDHTHNSVIKKINTFIFKLIIHGKLNIIKLISKSVATHNKK